MSDVTPCAAGASDQPGASRGLSPVWPGGARRGRPSLWTPEAMRERAVALSARRRRRRSGLRAHPRRASIAGKTAARSVWRSARPVRLRAARATFHCTFKVSNQDPIIASSTSPSRTRWTVFLHIRHPLQPAQPGWIRCDNARAGRRLGLRQLRRQIGRRDRARLQPHRRHPFQRSGLRQRHRPEY
jgi:hypothetical protein